MMPSQEEKLKVLFTEAYHDFEKGLHARAFFKVHDHILGGDLVQDTFIKTWSYLVREGKIDMMKAFLYHVLNGLIIDEYRKKKATSLDVLIEKGFEPVITNPESLFDILDGEKAFLLIKCLPKKYQKVMRMKYIQDLTLEEMSAITGQSKNTMAVQTHRGLEKLRVIHKKREMNINIKDC